VGHHHLGTFPETLSRPDRFRLAPIHSAGSPLCGAQQTAPLGRPLTATWTATWKMLGLWKICGKSMGNLWEIYGTWWENGAPTVATSIALVICCCIGLCQSLSTASVSQEHV